MIRSAEEISWRSVRNARAEAAVWVVRLHGDERTPELEAGFRAWLAADPKNARQFEHISDAWELGGGVTADGLPRMRTWRSSSARTRGWLPTAVAAASVAICVWWYVGSSGSAYTTGHGEQRLVRLQDGSTVYLNSDSHLRVEFNSRIRRVKLDSGEGLFEVAKDPQHPFVVDAGARHVTALGTTFVVRYEPTRTAITLVEGKVAVSGDDASAPLSEAVDRNKEQDLAAHPITLTPGERLVLAQDAPPLLDTPRIDAVTAWRRGQVLLEATSLPEAVSEMNRYDKRRLVIDDPRLNSVRVSGVYRTGDSLGFATAVAELQQLDVSENGDEIHLHLPPSRNK
jgi:transmembrane sensor